jgi:hypothetical protein
MGCEILRIQAWRARGRAGVVKVLKVCEKDGANDGVCCRPLTEGVEKAGQAGRETHALQKNIMRGSMDERNERTR